MGCCETNWTKEYALNLSIDPNTSIENLKRLKEEVQNAVTQKQEQKRGVGR